MIILYIAGIYFATTYGVGGLVFLKKSESNYINSWSQFYFALSPITVPMISYILIKELIRDKLA